MSDSQPTANQNFRLTSDIFTLIYDQLRAFSNSESFWSGFDTAFGTQYNRRTAETLQAQWQTGDFAQIPSIEVISSNILGKANGAYAASKNKIYLSDNFVANATSASLQAVLLEEIGHFVDVYINQVDSAGDEGAIFAALVQGESLDATTLQALKAEDDHATIMVNGQAIQVEQQNFTGTAGNDTITGTSGDDVIEGLAGNDTINTGLGFDSANGGTGDDLLIVDYSIGDTGRGMNLSSYAGTEGFSGTAYRTYSDNFNALDRVDFFEINRFEITGTSQNDNIITASGNDTINGGAGDDIINGNGGVDILDGGDGSDTLILDLSSQTGNIVINNATAGINLTGIVTATNFENFTLTTGSGNDTFNQSGLVNNIVVRGNDTITTGAGNDTINTGLGLDNANGGTGDDLLIVDYSIGDTGRGMNLSSYAGTEGFSGTAYRTYSDNFNALDRVDFFEINRFEITGTSQNDNIITASGNDTINGGAGDDIINGNGGVDILDGGDGSDTLILDLSSQTGNIVINNATAGINLTGIVTATNFENFTLTTGSGNDTFNQSGLVNNIVVRGNDTITTGAGNDTINTGLGLDNANGGTGDDLLIVDYSIGDTGRGMNLSSYAGTEGFSGTAYRTYSDNFNALDRVDFFEINRFEITGTSQNDNIITASGNDTINGGAGDDIINGNGGVDILDGGDGSDTLILDLSSQTGNIVINNATAGINLTGIVTATNFENFTITTGSGNDTINTGLGQQNTVTAGTGDDLLIVDYSIGDTGRGMNLSSYAGTEGFSGTAYRTYSDNFNALDRVDFFEINRFEITGTSQNDNITTASGNDTINGGAGDDIINGNGGVDILDGGDGSDTLILDLSSQTGNIVINNATAGINLTGIVTATNFENFTITTGSGNDTINTGLGQQNTVTAGTGDDLLIVDYSIGDTGRGMNLSSYAGTEGFSGTAYRTYSDNFNALDRVDFFEINRFEITGTSQNDNITTASGNDTINGGAGDDIINGNGGVDILDGGDGSDTLILDLSSQTGNIVINNATAGINLTGIVTATNFENFTITTGSGNDTINTGLGQQNTVTAGTGDDLLIVDYSIGDTGRGMNLSSYAGTEGFSGTAYRTYSDNFNALDRVDFFEINRFEITGTSQNDNITTASGNDTINGGAGDDTINGNGGVDILDGGDGSDTLILDLSSQTGNIVINNATAGINLTGIVTATNFENFTITTGSGNDTINTGLGQQNTVTAGTGDDLLIVDYSIGDTGRGMNLSSYAGTEGFSGTAYRTYSDNFNALDRVDFFEINRFEITGTSQNDNITTASGNDTINGGAGDDTINAGAGDDTIDGVNSKSLTPGLAEKDTLTGGAGSDRFILGSTTNVYYDDGNITTNGNTDYATITDFNPLEDQVQLRGIASNYRLEIADTNTNLYLDKAGTEPDELIALFQNVTGLNLTSTAFEYISPVVAPTSTVSFSSGTYSVNENGAAQITLLRSGSTTNQTTLTVFSTNGTAITPADYNNTPILVTFEIGETSKTITIPIVDDSIYEPNETINLAITNVSSDANLGTQNTAILTILDNDARPGAIAFTNSNFSINENGTAVQAVTLNRTGGSDGAVTVTLTPSDGTAIALGDYTNTPITVNFANGETSKIIPVPIVDDTQYEGNETVNLTLSTPTGGATLGTQTTATLTIVDNDAVSGVIQFSNANYSVNENGTPVTAVTLTRTNGSEGEVSATITLTNGTATAGSDYGNSPITVTFANGETSKIVTIPIIDDSILESNETINLTLSNPTNGATIGTQNSAVVNIIDNDFKPTLTVNITAEQVSEGNTIQGTVTRNTATTEPLTVTLVNSENAQITVPVTVTIPVGANSATFNITAVDDTLIELPKNYTIIASAAGFLSGSDSLAIIDNDGVNLTLTLDTNNINEDGGKASATLTRNIVTDTPLLVQLSSSDTTEATVPATVIIAANQASATFEIQGVDDTILDGTQTVVITAKPTYTATNVVTNVGQATANLNVVDNESSSLNLVIDKDIIAETGTATATITRNTDVNSELIVNLSSSDTTEATVPNTVTIPVGQNSATFTITGVSDGINDGSQAVTITASATGLNSGSDSLEITDINVPDLMMTQLHGVQTTYTSKQSQFTYTATNNGIISAAGSWKDRVYLSTDNKLETNDTLLGEFGIGSTENPANFLPGTSYNRTVPYFAPRTPGQYYLIGVTDSGNTINEGVSIGENNNNTITPLTITPAYRGTVYTDTETGLMGNSITFRGKALSNSDNSPVAYEFVKVRVENNDIIREFDAFTDGNGNFTQQFTPLPGEAGTYNINAYFPGNSSEDSTAEDQFKLLGMRFNSIGVSNKVIADQAFTGKVNLQNLTDVALNGLTYTIEGAPSNWNIQVNTPSILPGSGNSDISYTITAPNNSVITQDTFDIKLTSAEGVSATLPVSVNLERTIPRLAASTSLVSSGMLRGNQTAVEFDVKNEGGAVANDIEVLLPDASWLKLASPTKINSLAPGESTKVTLLLTPDANLPLTEYKGNIVLDADGNDGDLALPFNFRAISAAVGNIRINAADELTYFAEGSPKLANATVTLRDYFTDEIIANVVTDSTGIINLSNIKEGNYNLEVKAENHETFRQTIQLNAGETEDVNAFLSRQTVKYIWTVTPTEIEDKYTVSVESVFETNVPIPTIVIDPPLIDFKSLQVVGQVMQIDMTITNHGLIATNNVSLSVGSHPFYKIEPLIKNVPILGAKSSITIPVKITRIADFNTLSSNTLSINNSELATLATPAVECRISVGVITSYKCGDQDIKLAIPIPTLNVQGNCFSSPSDFYTPVVIPGTPESPQPNPNDPVGPNPISSDPKGYSYITHVITPIVDVPSSCDPCTQKTIQAIVRGAVSLVPLVGGNWKPCTTIIYDDITGLITKEITIKSLISLARHVFACTKEAAKQTPPGKVTRIFGAVYDVLTACIPPFGEIDSSNSFSVVEASKTFNTESLASSSVPKSALDLIGKYEIRLQSVIDAETFLFGNVVWLQGENGNLLSDYLDNFLSGITDETTDGAKISIAERNEILNLLLPEGVTESNVNQFIDRWNRTIDYWDAGIFYSNDVPLGQNSDFLALDILNNKYSLANQAIELTNTEGFSDIIEALNYSINELEKALDGSGGVCAKVRITIDQDAVMTRSAFLGDLEIQNGNLTNLTNLTVTLQVKDAQGNIVNDLFGITTPDLKNITALDGTGILTGDDPNTSQNEGIGSAQWRFIPTNLAAPEVPTTYSIGGTLSYTENGAVITVPLLSTPITVYPQAELYLDYFQSRNVYGDDPFTTAIEPSVPFSLGVLVSNQGKGDAKNLSITSAQPKIIENEKGLLVDFQIIGSKVNGIGASPSLTVDFGNIAAGKTGVADWLLKSSLQGKFTDYTATFEHINSLGKSELSLIKEVSIHELIHQVQVNHPNPDTLPDFLVNETFDAKFTPDIIYFSSGGTAPVKAVKDATIDAPATLNDLTVQISATVDNGWTYFELAEPSNSQFDIVKIQRADGTEINLNNIWTTDRTFPGTGQPKYENILHFLDNTSAGNTTYTVTYTPGGPTVTDIIDVSPDPRATAINAISVDFSEAIKANSFDYNDLSLTVNGGTNLINSTVTILPLSPTRYQITGLNSLTTTDGEYTLAVNASGIEDTTGKLGTGSLTETWVKAATGDSDTTPPIVTDIIDLLIDPRNQPVSNLNVTFSEKIDLSTFNWQDITLTRNGGTNLINNTVTISATNDTTYRINGLSGLTTTDGTYTLTVNGSGIQDLSGNAGTETQLETWVMDTTAPIAPSNIVVAGISPNNINNVETLYTTSLQNTTSLQILTTSGQTLINTTTPTISGELGEAGLKVFFYDKITNQLLKQATVTETQFSSSVQLPSPGAGELEIRVQDAAGNTTNTTLSLFADIAPPVISQFLNVPTSTPNPVNTIDVQFSEQINLNTFDKSDITLSRDGVNLTLPNTVTVTYLSDTTYSINGLDSLTNTPGLYSLKVDATTIQDNAGNSGDAAKTATFTIAAPPTPGITLIQSSGSTAVTEGGNTDSYTLVLKTQPTADVTVTLNGGNQITIDKTTITFTPANWNTAQTVTVTAVNDTIPEGNHTSTISHSVNSTDSNYNNATLPNIAVSITDNDAEIRGMKWHDFDGNGVKDAGETGLQGWTIYLDTNTNGQLDNGEISTITDTNGNYEFTNLRPGIYTIAEVQQPGWNQTFPGVNVTTTNAEIPLYTPTLDIISPSSNNEVQLNFNAANYIVKEDGTAVTEIWVTRTGNTSNTVSATLSFIDGTAKGCGCAASSVNNDFNNIPITITFAENETSKLVYVQNALLGNPNAIKIRNDDKVEGDEYFTIKLTNPTGGATIGNQSSATVTIIDDETPSNITVTPPLETPSTTISSLVDSQATSLINLDNFRADSRFANIKGNGLTTVIIDTGIDLNHPIFGADADNNGIADKIVYEYDFADNDTDASDKNNHGSHIASIFTSVAPDSNIIALKVFKDSGSGSFSDLEKALQWVAENSNTYNIASVNLSLGDSQNWTTATSRYGIGDELAAIASQNIIINAAAGNSFYQYGSNPGLAYPAIDPNVIAVSAVWANNFGSQKNFVGGAIDYTTTADQIASFSQRDPSLLDIFAPGILITGANASGGTTSMGGTSQATAYMTGVATLAQQIAEEKLGRKLTVNEFRNLLDTNSVIINDGDNENDNVTNTGKNYPRVDLLKLAEGILNFGGATSNPNPVDPGNNNNNGGITTFDNTINLVHTVNLTAGEVRTGIDFGNQQIIVNHPPTVTNLIATQTATEDTAFSFTIPENTFTDIDAGDILTYSATLENGNALPTWLTFNSTTRTFSGTSTNDNVGNLNVKAIATDKAGATVSDIFTITVENVNDAPTLQNAIAAQIAAQDTAFSFTFDANTFIDVDAGDNLTYSATLQDGSNLPNWLKFNATTRTFSGTPTNADVSILNIKLTATDTSNKTAIANFALQVENVNDAPTLQNAIADQITQEDTAFSFTFDANTFIDIDAGDNLTYSATLKDGSNLPSWLKFNPDTRTFSGTPAAADLGNLTIEVRAKDNSGVSTIDRFALTVEHNNGVPTFKLEKIADDIFKIFNSSGKSKIQVTLTERSSNLVNELGVFTVDDAQGNINGIAPGAAGYTQAALERSQVIFSAISNLPNGFNANNLTQMLEFNSSDNLRFYLVKNSTTNSVKAGVTPLTDIVFSDPLKQKITDLGSEQFALAWNDGSNNTADFKDMVVKIQSTNDSLPLGTNLQGKPQGAMIDLRGVTTEVKADFVVNREAAFNNFIGFYKVTDENGGIDTNGDGTVDILTGQAGYTEAAIRGRVAGIDLTVNDQGTATYSGTFQPGSIFVPFIIANGSPDALLDTNPHNNPAVYFPFLGANTDQVDHIRLLGNNVFGFEDLPNGGDKDFNDAIVGVKLSII